MISASARAKAVKDIKEKYKDMSEDEVKLVVQ
jgi:hypothetical protein